MAQTTTAIADALVRISDPSPQIELEPWLDCFTSDGGFEMRRGAGEPTVYDLKGHDELAPWFEAHAQRIPLGMSHQLLGQIRVDLDGDSAQATSLVLLIHNLGGVPTLKATVRFYDSLVRC